MPVGPGSTIDEVWKFGESDSNSLFSDLLNRLGDSVRSALNAIKSRVTSLESSYSLVEAATGIRHYSVADETARDLLTGPGLNDLVETRNNSRIYRFHSLGGWRLWQSEWASITLGSGWTASVTVAARVMDGRLCLRGRLAGGASGSTFGTLPVDLRPDALRRGIVVTGASAGTTPITINTDGTMIANTATDLTLDPVDVPLWNA